MTADRPGVRYRTPRSFQDGATVVRSEVMPMDDSHRDELLAMAEPVHRRAARRGAARWGELYEDMLQEILTHFLEVLPRYNPALGPIEAFAEYQARTAINRKHFGRWRRQAKFPAGHSTLDRPSDHDPADVAEAADLIDRLHQELADLTPKQRAAVGAAFGLDGRPALAGADLGAAIGAEPKTAQDRIRRAVKQLAGALGADPDAVTLGYSRGNGIRAERQRAERDAHLAGLAGPVDGTIEARRRRVAELVGLGLSFRAMARVVGVCRETCRADLAVASAPAA